jgi:hypothetical protein
VQTGIKSMTPRQNAKKPEKKKIGQIFLFNGSSGRSLVIFYFFSAHSLAGSFDPSLLSLSTGLFSLYLFLFLLSIHTIFTLMHERDSVTSTNRPAQIDSYNDFLLHTPIFLTSFPVGNSHSCR